jgi:hypothetical protein
VAPQLSAPDAGDAGPGIARGGLASIEVSFGEATPMEPPRRHSRLGIASVAVFTLNTAVALLILITLLWTPGLRRGYAERFNATIPLTTCATPVVYLVGLALAIFGLRDKTRPRLFPILGIVLNGLAIPAQIALNAFWILLNV